MTFCVQVKDLETHLQRLKSDLHNCVGFIQDPKKLKESVQVIYARYMPPADVVSGACGVVGAETSCRLIRAHVIVLTNTLVKVRVVMNIHCKECWE